MSNLGIKMSSEKDSSENEQVENPATFEEVLILIKPLGELNSLKTLLIQQKLMCFRVEIFLHGIVFFYRVFQR